VICFHCGGKGHFRNNCPGIAQQSASRRPNETGARVFKCNVSNETACKSLSRDVDVQTTGNEYARIALTCNTSAVSNFC